MTRITPVLLSGGTGTRLWPLSRQMYPKQLLPLVGTETMLQETVRRVTGSDLFGPLVVVANSEHRFVIAEQLRAIGVPQALIVLEPEARNTAPAAATAALLVAKEDADGLILIMPADHVIGDVPAFHRAIEIGLSAAREGALVLFGIRPNRPDTGYGYIRIGEVRGPGVHAISGFVEKPDAEAARQYLSTGHYLWNSGIFLLPVRAFLDELAVLAPDVLRCCERALQAATKDFDFLRLSGEAFRSAPSISIDYAVMERTNRAAVVPVNFPWSDVGSWSALWELGEKDETGNVVLGDVLLDNARNSYVRSEGRLVTAIGVEDLIIIATQDAVLVTARDCDQQVKRVVERLKTEGHAAATQTQRVHRPWGYFQSVHRGERFQVKRITVNAGAKLSLQKHFHRAEHWVVVSGTALVTRDGQETLLRENESIFLPLGCVHRLENPGRLPLDLIEVQSGPYLGEDDIVRIEDIYARLTRDEGSS